MIVVTNTVLPVVALLVAGAYAASPAAPPPPPGGIAPRASIQPAEGGTCDINTDRVACANAGSIVMCHHNKWVALATCGSSRVCSNGICAFADQTSGASGTVPSATTATPPASGTSGAKSPAATPSSPSSTGTQPSASQPRPATSQVAASSATSGLASTSAGVLSHAAPPSNDAGAGGGTGGGTFGITCAKFSQAVSKASAAIGQSYPQPSETKCQAFLQGIPKGHISSAREAAMFLANILWESDGLRAKEEYDCVDKPDWCAMNYMIPGDSHPGKAYWGRGYIQLTWKYNYEAASKALFGNNKLVDDPTLASKNENVAWDVSFWFWSENVHSDPGVQAGKFGASINKINGAIECRGLAQEKAKKRYAMYKAILPIIAPGQTPDESGCYN